MREKERRGCSFAKGAVRGWRGDLFSLRPTVEHGAQSPRPRGEWEQRASRGQEQATAWLVRRPPGGGGAKEQISEYGAEMPEIPGKVCVTQGQAQEECNWRDVRTTLQRTSRKPYLSTPGELGRAISAFPGIQAESALGVGRPGPYT